jgi:enterochelin esterase-like enzyme
MKKEIRDNQALNSHMLYFDPINSKLDPNGPAMPVFKAGARPVFPTASSKPIDNVPGVRTLDDGSFEITFYAPGAKTVEVAGGNNESMPGRYSMAPSPDTGYWQVIIRDVKAGFHFLDFFVDGVQTFHPTLPFGYGCSRVMNFIEVADPDLDFYLLKDVPHGSVRMEIYKSSVTGRFRNCWVYTPPCYDQNTGKSYPVIYIQHGGGENETGWIWQGKINYIVDNLLAAGQCEEMLIVMNSSATYAEVGENSFTVKSVGDVIVKDCVPFIDANFRTKADRWNRAISGLSMGGGHAKTIAFEYNEYFANLGVFSSGAGFEPIGNTSGVDYDYSAFFASPKHYSSLMKLTFIGCGEQDPRHQFTGPQVKSLQDQGFDVQYHSYPGYHEWDVWRFCARDFIKQLFK